MISLRQFQFLFVALFYLGVFSPLSTAGTSRKTTPVAEAAPEIRFDAAAAGFVSYVLPNGFKIILARYPSAPSVRVELVVKTGSLLEGYGESGMAHLLEHMLFKGAGSRENIKADLTRIGARWNADTTADRTSYFEVLSSDPTVVDEAIRIEADRFSDARFTPADLASEMTVVRNELEQNDSRPTSVVMRSLLRQSFFWHGYGRPTIGARSDIEGAPFEILKAFHAKHYRPDNAFLIVSGNFDQKRVLSLASKLFARTSNPATPKLSSWTRETPQAVTNKSEIALSAGTTMAMSAWKIPGSYDRQTIALALGSAAICSGDWGSLRKDIVLGQKIATSASCFGFEKPQAGLLIGAASAGQEEDAEKLSQSLHEHIERAARQGISREQMERAREEEANAFVRIGNSHEAFAKLLSDAEVGGDWRLAFLQHDMAMEVSVDEANTALQTWIVPNNRSDVLLRHADAITTPALTTPVNATSRVAGKNWPSVVTYSDKLPQNAADLAKVTIAVPLGDPRVRAALISRKTQGDLAWVVVANDFGNEEALSGKTLACKMASSLFAFGGGGFTRDELDARLEKLQANWELSLGRLVIDAPRKNIEAALDILLTAWADAAMPIAEFERLKASAIAGAEASLKDPTAIASAALELRFDNYPEKHPRKALALEQELAGFRALTYDQVKSCQTEFSGLSHVRMAIVGDFSEQDVKNLWAKISKLPAGKVPYERIREAAVPANVDSSPIIVSRPDKPSANIAGMSLLSVTDGAEDFAALRIAVNILGGSSDSRVWKRLRETGGLAYSAGASLAGSSFEPRSVFSISASAASDQAELALSKLQEELATALRDGFSVEEVTRAKEKWVQDRKRYANDERLFAARLSQGMLNDRDFVWIAKYDERIASVTAKTASEALRKYLGSAPIVWMIGKGSK